MAMVIALPHNHTVDYSNGDVVIIMFMKVKGMDLVLSFRFIPFQIFRFGEVNGYVK